MSNAISVQYILECFGSGILSDSDLLTAMFSFFLNLGGLTAVRHYCQAFSFFNLVFLSLFFCIRNGNWFFKVVLTLSVVLVLLFRFEGVMPFYGTTNFEQG